MRLKIWEVILLVLAAVCLTVLVAARTIGASATIREGAVTRTARPGVAFWRESVDVELRVDSSGLPTCAATADISPIYAALVIDRSGSMAGPPLQEARNAASDFVDLMNLIEDGDAVAVVSFNDSAQMDRSFNSDRAQSVRAIQGINGGGGTDIAAGLALATQQFGLNPPPVGARPVIILLSDGQSDENAARAAASQAKGQGIRVVTIALGGANRTLLAELASSPADFYETSDPTALLNIYGAIAEGLVGSAATDLQVTEYYNDQRFDLDSNPYRTTVQSGNPIVWQAPFVGQRGRSLGYVLRPNALGWHQVSPTPGQMSLIDCNGQPVSQATPTGPRVLVLFPVWLLYIFPVLAGAWLLYRLLKALLHRPEPPTIVSPGKRQDVEPKAPVKQEDKKPSGSDVTHGRPAKPRKRDEATDQ